MASTQALVDRSEAVYRELRSMRFRFRLGAWITLIVGGLLLLLVVGYFSYGYSEISSFRDPELIVSLVGDMADQQIPALKKMAEDQVNQNAAVWAEQASQQVLAQVEPLRKQIESMALQQADEAIAKIDVVGEKKFREMLEQNRETVQNAINQLKNDEEISEGAVIALKEAVEKEFQIDADSQVDALVTLVSDVNANMDKLAAGENLTREQRAERRVLMLARRIHVDRFGNMKLEHVSENIPIAAVSEMVEESEAKRLRKEAKEASVEVPAAETVEMAAAEETTAEAPAAETKTDKPKEEPKPADKPEEKKEAADKEKPVDKPKEEEKAKPAEKPEEKKEGAAEEKPADKPNEEAKPAEKPEEKKEGVAEEKPADKPKEETKTAEKAEEKKEA